MGVGSLVKVVSFNAVRRPFPNSWCGLMRQSKKAVLPSFSTMSSRLPPSCVRGMTILQKELFDKDLLVPCVVVPVAKADRAMPILRCYLLKLPNFRPVQCPLSDGESSRGKVCFSDKPSCLEEDSKIAIFDPTKINSFNDIAQTHRDTLADCDIGPDNFFVAQLTIGYDNWKADEIFRAVIPEQYESVSGYSLCGHIVHLNLREQLSPFKNLIGQVLLDKVVAARTVVNKTDSIDTTYRTFSMEILSGENDLVAKTKENKCLFVFDFSKVYWNPRLSTEHQRIVSFLKRGDILYDVFCGVGPFSIPASKKGCRVLANDLNPESIKWLKESSKLNKTLFQISNKDGRDFILEDIKNDLLNIDDDFDGDIHIVMNLPALAVEFLPAFQNLFNREEMVKLSKLPEPQIHVYCFTKGEADPSIAALKLVEDKLGSKLNDDLIEVHFVRNVAPLKEMMRVSFKLSPDVLAPAGKRPLQDHSTDVPSKKICSKVD